jgi:hypothetical protein
VREDQILPHLAAMAILLNGHPSGQVAGLTTPDGTAGLIDQLRTAGIVLTYDPDTQTIRTGDSAPDRGHHGQQSLTSPAKAT